jgi:hypothetical protein
MIGLVNGLFLKLLEESSWEYRFSPVVDTSLELKETLSVAALLVSEVVGNTLVTEAYDTPKEKLLDKAAVSWVNVLRDNKENTAWKEKIAEIKLVNRVIEL